MFIEENFNQDLSKWDISNVTKAKKCFILLNHLMVIFHMGC